MRQYIGAPYKDAAFLRAAQTQHFTEALGKHRSKHAQDKIFRHEQNVIHENGMPKPVYMHIKFPDDRKIRNADQVVRQKASDSRNEAPRRVSASFPLTMPAANAAATNPIMYPKVSCNT